LIKKVLMRARKELTVFISFRWQRAGRDDTARGTERLLETLVRLGLDKGMPLHWNLPNTPYLEKKHPQLDGIITEIKTRIKACGDCVIPMGYSGAFHPLLSASEVEKELTWSINNPWKTGIVEQFKERPRILIPTMPDLLRPAVAAIYKKSGFTLIGVPFTTDGQTDYSFGPWKLKEAVELFLYHHIATPSYGLRIPRHAPYACLVFDLPQHNTYEQFEEILHVLSKRFHVRYNSLKGYKFGKAKKQIPDSKIPQPPMVCNPVSRIYLKSANPLRTKDKKSDKDFSNILKLVSYNNGDLDPTKIRSLDSLENGPFLRPRIISAHMPGEVTLPGTSFNSVFDGGSLHSLIKTAKNYLTGCRPRSLLNLTKKTCNYTTDGVFSFEDENSRGLLEKLHFELPGTVLPTTIAREYYFVGDFPYLIVSMEVSYSELTKPEVISGLLPFELPLVRFKKETTPLLYCLYEDGTKSEVALPDLPTGYVVFGSIFYLHIHNAYLVFGFVPHRNPLIQGIQLRTEQQKPYTTLWVNLLGTYNQAETVLYGNTRELCSFFIGISDQAPHKIPFFPKTVLKTVPQAQVGVSGS